MRIILFGGSTFSLMNFRGHLIKALVDAGHEVVTWAPESDAEIEAQLRAIGASFQSIPLNRTGLGPLADLHSLWTLQRRLRVVKPDLFIAYTVKPVIWGTIAAKIVGIPRRFAMITGLGSGLQKQGVLGSLLAHLITSLYRFALSGNEGVFFQNPDDRAFFESKKILPKHSKVTMINGSGVDLVSFPFSELPSGPCIFILISRLLKDKGIIEYVNASIILKQEYPDARFQLLGPLDPNPTSVTQSELSSWEKEGVVDYLGVTRDVRPFLVASHVFVLPSYGEGTPRSVLEAMAIGRAVITTDAPGCRETVLHGKTGFLVPTKDTQALAEAMKQFLLDSTKAIEMGRAGRAIAEQKFDVHKVNKVILDAITSSS